MWNGDLSLYPLIFFVNLSYINRRHFVEIWGVTTTNETEIVLQLSFIIWGFRICDLVPEVQKSTLLAFVASYVERICTSHSQPSSVSSLHQLQGLKRNSWIQLSYCMTIICLSHKIDKKIVVNVIETGFPRLPFVLLTHWLHFHYLIQHLQNDSHDNINCYSRSCRFWYDPLVLLWIKYFNAVKGFLPKWSHGMSLAAIILLVVLPRTVPYLKYITASPSKYCAISHVHKSSRSQ